MNLRELEEKYLMWKDAYYRGEEQVSDEMFDELEEQLLMLGSSIVDKVGAPSRGDKFTHTSKMLSLDKIKSEGTAPVDEFNKWVMKKEDEYYECSPKLDGNASNIIYLNGQLQRALTRGDGEEGTDITRKLLHCIPKTISLKGKVEIRGEVVISNSLFDEKYLPQGYKNARNYVAGVLNRDEDVEEQVLELKFIAVELRNHEVPELYMDNSMDILKSMGFECVDTTIIHYTKFREMYDKLLHYRETKSLYRLDGFVVKTLEMNRAKYGENNHHPKWALAIKFPPKESITFIIDIEWRLGKTGELTPVGILEPVDIDGSTVQRVSLYNYGSLVRDRLFPGTMISLIKSGDIIPKVQKILKPSPRENFYLQNIDNIVPDNWNGMALTINGPHLYCKDALDGDDVKIKKLTAGVKILSFDGIGPSICEKLYRAGIKHITDFFDRTKFNEESLVTSGFFKKGKALSKIIDEVNSVKNIHLENLIHSLQFNKVGSTISKEVAKYHSGVTYDFKGLEIEVIETLTNLESKEYAEIKKFANTLVNRNIEVVYPTDTIISEPDKEIQFYYEMTGKPPKIDSISCKDDFKNLLSKYGYTHSPLKTAHILITDNIYSKSSKMKTAKDLGLTIITYEDFLEQLNN